MKADLALVNDARIIGLTVPALFAMIVAKGVYNSVGASCEISCGSNGVHSAASLHYTGNAFDCRTKHLPRGTSINDLAKVIREALGPDFDVVVEPTHIHIEFQPKKGY
jgi:hypothetical protein